MKTLSDLFDVRYGNSLALAGLKRATPDDGIAFVSRKTRDNGVAAYVAPLPGEPLNPAGELTCALNGEGGVLATFVQERPYYTAYHVACLSPKHSLTIAQKLYYCACIWANHYRYSWGRQANRSLKDILLPEPKEMPAWLQDAEVDVTLRASDPATPQATLALNSSSWKAFAIADLFDIKKGTRLTKTNMRPGRTPFVGAVEFDNGWSNSVAQPAEHPGNTISINYNGTVGEAVFYQPVPYRCSDDVNVLYPKFEMSPRVALFMATVIRHERYRFNYGRKWHLERMAQTLIGLPARADGSPDFEFMEAFIDSLPYSSRL